MNGCSALVAAATLVLALPAAAQEVSRRQAIEAWIDRIAGVGSMAAVSVAVVDGDSVLLTRARGFADVESGRRATVDTRFYLASTTKAFTALAIAMLDHRGAIELDAPLSAYLPGVALHAPLSPSRITIRDLLAMRDGIGEGPVTMRTSYTGEWTEPELARLLALHPPDPAGNAFRYSNIGYITAGLAVQGKVGLDWRTLVEREVLLPLGMRHTHSRLSDVPPDSLAMPHGVIGGRMRRIAMGKSDRTLHAAGGHFATAHDIARFLVAQMNGGRIDGRSVFPAEVLAETHRSHVAQNRDAGFVRRTGWGLGWDIATYEGDTMYERGGGFGGYSSRVSMIPARRHGAVVLATVSSGSAEAIAQGIYDILAGRATPARLDSLHARVKATHERVRARSADSPSASAALAPPLQGLIGRYSSDAWGTLELLARGDTLIARMGDSHGVVHATRGADVLEVRLLGGAQRLRPARDARGVARSITIEPDMTFTRRTD
jgi:CubicO group peptidase (beta-lactamase class C family)